MLNAIYTISTLLFLLDYLGNNPNTYKVELLPFNTMVFEVQTHTNISPDTITVNRQQLIKPARKKGFLGLTTISGDTIVEVKNFYQEIKFLDINEDGYKDIRVSIMSNSPNQCDNYLFDPQIRTYKFLENCDLDIQLIKGSSLYYSYERAGCADMNWKSNLSKIEKGKLVDIGVIYGNTCGDEYDGIKVFKLKGDSEELVVSFEVGIIDKYKKHKWGFIKSYWSRNYRIFE